MKGSVYKMKSLDLILGLYDNPEKQEQDVFSVNLYTSNLAVFGNAMSGKTTFIKTLLIRMHQVIHQDEEEIYILDFSNNLEMYKSLPFIRAYFDAFNEENIRRMFRIIDDKLQFNIKELPGKNFMQRTNISKAKHITFILDDVHALFSEDRYVKYQEDLLKFARDGLSKGVSIVFTANEPSGGIRKLLSSFAHMIAFDINKDLYSDLFSEKVNKPMILKGRGIASKEGKCYEFQAFLPYNSDVPENNEEKNIENVICLLQNDYQLNVSALQELQLKSLSGDLDRYSWSTYTQEPIEIDNYLVVGLDYYTCDPVKINLLNAKTIAIYGKKQFGKTNLLKLILKSLSPKEKMRVVYFDDSRKELTNPEKGILDYLTRFGELYPINNEEELAVFISENYVEIPDNIDIDDIEEKKLISSKSVITTSNYRENLLTQDISYEKKADDNRYLSKKNDSNGEINDIYQVHQASILNNTSDLSKIDADDFGTDLNKIKIEDNDEYEKIAEEPMVEDETKYERDNSNSYKELEELSTQPFTVFIIQSRLFYSKKTGSNGRHIIERISRYLEDCENVLFIFSDVQKIVDLEIRTYFNNSIKHAFLLDDIMKFLQSRGAMSVFSEYDENELKESFGKSILGDGFYFNIDMDTIQKLKMLKVED